MGVFSFYSRQQFSDVYLVTNAHKYVYQKYLWLVMYVYSLYDTWCSVVNYFFIWELFVHTHNQRIALLW